LGKVGHRPRAASAPRLARSTPPLPPKNPLSVLENRFVTPIILGADAIPGLHVTRGSFRTRNFNHIASLEDMSMTTIDFSPLFRSVIGFDRLANTLENAYRGDPVAYPPYNIELVEDDHYRITMAVAGFTEDDLDVQVKEGVLTVSGGGKDDKERKFLYRGIANRSFERRFQLADYVRVEKAELRHGLLHIDLVREVPEAMRPRRIEIKRADEALIEGATEAKSQAA
jgi:molecular chaperone IbpA